MPAMRTRFFLLETVTLGSVQKLSPSCSRPKVQIGNCPSRPRRKRPAFHLADTNCTERIRKGDWDFVVLQEQSQKSGLGGEYTKGFHQAVGALSKMIRATDAKPCLYLTWGRQSGDKRNPKVYPDFEAMQQKITAAYLEAAEINDAIVFPTGWAYAETKKSSMERFNTLYKKDGSHPSASGAYLVACVFWGSLTGKDPTTIRWTGGINNKEAIHLRKAAKISLQN